MAQDATDETGAVLGVGTPAAERVDAARLGLRRIRQRQAIVMLLGLVVFVGGATLFDNEDAKSRALADNGARTLATIVDTDLFDPDIRARFTHAWFSTHVDVRFTSVTGQVVVARCYIGEDDVFAVGEIVDIVYDLDQPTRAQLAQDPALGPSGAPFFFALIFGVIVFATGFSQSRLASRGLRALSAQGRTVAAQAVVSLGRRGRKQPYEHGV